MAVPFKTKGQQLDLSVSEALAQGLQTRLVVVKTGSGLKGQVPETSGRTELLNDLVEFLPDRLLALGMFVAHTHIQQVSGHKDVRVPDGSG